MLYMRQRGRYQEVPSDVSTGISCSAVPLNKVIRKSTRQMNWLRISVELYDGFLKQGYPQIIHFNGIIHYKPTILDTPIYGTLIFVSLRHMELVRFPRQWEQCQQWIQLSLSSFSAFQSCGAVQDGSVQNGAPGTWKISWPNNVTS